MKLINKQRLMSKAERWIQQVEQNIMCPRCHSNENVFVSLNSCSHTFCLLCTTYIYIKFKSEVKDDRDIKCIECNHISTLSNYQLDLINQTIQGKLIPMIGQENNFSTDNKFPRSKRNSSQTSNEVFYETIDKKMRSQQHSFENITPSTKYFFSKCQSPNNSNKNKDVCPLHPNDHLNFLCFTCNNLLLCSKCVNAKTHAHHDLKSVKKGIDCILEQITLGKLQTSQKIQCMEMWQRRLDHGKTFLIDRADKTIAEIQNSFIELTKKLRSKQDQLILNCKNHFQTMMRQIDQQYNKISQYLNNYQNYHSKLSDLTKITTHSTFIKQFNKLKNQISKSVVGALQPKLLEMLSFQSTSMHQEIAQISQCIRRIKIDYRPAQIIKTNTIEDPKSEKKLKKDEKRVKTNFASLNSSRDKRDRKCAKTQQDQAKHQQKINFHNFAQKKGKELPAYISKFFDKHNIKPYHNGMSCLLDLQPFINNNSKTSSKILSKSAVPEEIQKRKKKDHLSLINDRLQRKTTNPNMSKGGIKSDNHRKRKLCS